MIARVFVFVIATLIVYFVLGIGGPDTLTDASRTGIALGAGIVIAFFGRYLLDIWDAIDLLRWTRELFR